MELDGFFLYCWKCPILKLNGIIKDPWDGSHGMDFWLRESTIELWVGVPLRLRPAQKRSGGEGRTKHEPPGEQVKLNTSAPVVGNTPGSDD